MKGMGRMVRALKDGWGFKDFKVNPNKKQSHSLWVTNEVMGGWRAVKVPADIPEDEALDALLHEAMVPE